MCRELWMVAEVRPPSLVHYTGTSRRCATSMTPSDIGERAEVVRFGDEHRAGVGIGASVASTSSTATPVGMPVASSSVVGSQHGTKSASTSPSRRERWSERVTTTLSPGRPIARQSAWLPCVEPPVE